MPEPDNSADVAENSEPTAVIGRPFPKGVSGNPGGRPRVVSEFRDKCRAYSDEALETLLEVMRSKSTNTTMPAKVSAVRTLLAYGFGEPASLDEGQGAQLVINILRLVGGDTTAVVKRLTNGSGS